jgi:hypothetical protein
MRVSRKQHWSPRDYKIADHTLTTVSNYKYLGIKISSDLKWNEHIKYVVSKGSKALGFFRRHFSGASKDLKKKCYISLVRPHLEYACSVWDSTAVSNSELLENVQRRAARFICGDYSRDSSVNDMLNCLQLVKMSDRRRIFRLSLFHKIVNNAQAPPPHDLTLKPVQRRLDNGRAFALIPARSNPFFSSFYPRTVRDWNALPEATVTAPTIATFKKLI